MNQAEKCTFCQPKDMDWRMIRQDDLTISFLSNPRLVRGHSIVIPRRHIEPPEKLTRIEKIAVFDELERLRVALLGQLALGVDIFQKTRPQVPEGHNGTKLNHLHFHVLPSEPGSELYERGLIWTPDYFSMLSAEETQTVTAVLRERSE